MWQSIKILEPHLHKKYFLRILRGMPASIQFLDSNRIVILYFCLSGLDLLDEMDNCFTIEKKQSMIEWIYSLQVISDTELYSGFLGSSTIKTNLDGYSSYKWGHLPSTYAALCTLLILGDNLDRVNRMSIINSLRILQLPNGGYKAAIEGTESDMRFVYCAACISYILDDWSGMDIKRTVQFILDSMSYDYGIGQGPELESHSGSTYCAVATLVLTNQLHRLSETRYRGLVRWLVMRLERFGFAGRPNKPEDTCYSFWTGGALKLLKAYDFIDSKDNHKFILATQDKYGGFSKWVNSKPDPMHTYLGLAGLSFMKDSGITEADPLLNISQRAKKHLKKIHEQWRK